jgi:pimeloyl-ACP methyl ester carboxylesterase
MAVAFTTPLSRRTGGRSFTAYYTFTGAGLDMQKALDQVVQLHDELKILPNKIVLIGVSVSAYMATEIAKLRSKNIIAICLLMPAIDLFAALDTFRKKEVLFTRKFYLAKDQFKASQLSDNSLKYFTGYMDLNHLFDLSFRGAKHCNINHFIENLRDFIKAGGMVCVACSDQDSMTTPESILSLETSLGQKNCIFRKIEWFHDVRRGMRSYSQVKPNNNKAALVPQKLQNVIDWLKEQVKRS